MTPENFTPEMLVLKDLAFVPYTLIAVGKITVPATLQTPEYYAISLWLHDVREPIMVTYLTIEERDSDLNRVHKCFKLI